MKFTLRPLNINELGQRTNQEDSIFPILGSSTADDRLFILCDGMGGHEKGEVASATVCETISNTILSQWNPDQPLSDDLLHQAIEKAYDALDAKDNGEEKKMGTTMTLVCLHSDGATVAHIGDSRVYHLRPADGNRQAYIVNKTIDHSVVNDLIKLGEITEEEAKNHPQKNVITRAMQPCLERRYKADVMHITDIKPGDYFYMCSDGMLEDFPDENILALITNEKMNDDEKVEMLINTTVSNKDNHTAHLIHITDVEGACADVDSVSVTLVEAADEVAVVEPVRYTEAHTKAPAQQQKKNNKLPLIIALVVALLAICAVAFFMLSKGDSNAPTQVDMSSPATVTDDNDKYEELYEQTIKQKKDAVTPSKTQPVKVDGKEQKGNVEAAPVGGANQDKVDDNSHSGKPDEKKEQVDRTRKYRDLYNQQNGGEGQQQPQKKQDQHHQQNSTSVEQVSV